MQSSVLKSALLASRSVAIRTYASAANRLNAPGLQWLQNENRDWSESQREVRSAVAKLCEPFRDEYWREMDKKHRWPKEFIDALTDGGWLGICMPEKYGGSGMDIQHACVFLQTLAESGGALSAVSGIHTNIFSLEPVVRYGTEEQRQRMIPPLIAGKERVCFGVTEPNAGLDTLRMETRAVRKGDKYVINGRKMWTTTAQQATHILLLCRTTPIEEVTRPSHGLSLFCTKIDRKHFEAKEIDKMGRSAIDTNMVFMDDWEVPAEDLIGEEGEGFKMMMVGMNAERCLVAAECIGIGYAALRRAGQYAIDRKVFGREIGQNQGIQHPLADAWMQLEAARSLTYMAARLYDEKVESGEYANAAKYLGARAGHKAAETAILTHGGVGYAKEYDVERYFREVMISRIAPVSEQMIMCYIAERVFGQKKSYGQERLQAQQLR